MTDPSAPDPASASDGPTSAPLDSPLANEDELAEALFAPRHEEGPSQ